MDGGALDLLPGYLIKVDPESGELLVWKAGSNPDNAELIGILVQNIFIADRHGHQADVSPDGRVHVINASGLPHPFAKAVGTDGYTDLGTLPHATTFVLAYVKTKDAVISFDGGKTHHLTLSSTKDQIVIPGLNIPAGATISAKNADAGQNYASLSLSFW